MSTSRNSVAGAAPGLRHAAAAFRPGGRAIRTPSR